MEPMAYENVVDGFVAAVPEFRPFLRDHIAANDEVLPHVLFGDLTRFVLDAYQQGHRDLVGRCLDFLEQALHSTDARLFELVAFSFVENVGPWDSTVGDFVSTWPPLLKKEAVRQAAEEGGKAL
ncbi:hypothetical protein [Nonomuraea sp. NPDC005650]|uniref:DUF7674 family protein n=1 Tax=Nonomuraea sp. NPDC005650 TaxID=3157045 RepID=UPI0033B1F8FE